MDRRKKNKRKRTFISAFLEFEEMEYMDNLTLFTALSKRKNKRLRRAFATNRTRYNWFPPSRELACQGLFCSTFRMDYDHFEGLCFALSPQAFSLSLAE